MTPFTEDAARCRIAQSEWTRVPVVSERLRAVREFRHRLVERTDELTAAVRADIGRDPDELIATDIVPTASAAKFLERRAERLLAPRTVGGRPLWLWGCRDVVHRRPRGVVGLIGTWNYPIFLNAIPMLHALAAGNGVLWKPSERTPRTAEVLVDLFLKSGFPSDLVRMLPPTREAGPRLAEADIDYLHFTGSETVGRKLAARLGERLIPSTLELSGCDAMFVLKDADVAMAAKLARFGSTLNSGQTCTAVRRAFVHRDVYASFVEHLEPLANESKPIRLVTPIEADRRAEIVDEAIARGCEARTATGDGTRPIVLLNPKGIRGLRASRDSLFAPLLTVTPFDSLGDALALAAESPFRLTASVFSSDIAAANELAARLPVVAVTINDVIVPTAHPGTPFGGRGASGWGVSQGDEGLLEMTVPQVVTVRRGFTPHAEPNGPADIPRGYLRMAHGRGLRERWRGLKQLVAGIRNRS